MAAVCVRFVDKSLFSVFLACEKKVEGYRPIVGISLPTVRPRIGSAGKLLSSKDPKVSESGNATGSEDVFCHRNFYYITF